MRDIKMAGEDKGHSKGKWIISSRLYINIGDIKNN